MQKYLALFAVDAPSNKTEIPAQTEASLTMYSRYCESTDKRTNVSINIVFVE